MKKMLPLLSLLLLTSFVEPLASCSNSPKNDFPKPAVTQLAEAEEPVAATDKEVYICDSKSATKYHFSENCRGLNNCKHTIVKVTLSKAKSSGRTLCGWED
jgi:hypothetical protein